MYELVRIAEHKGKKTVSARELHTFLESKRDFSNWIKDRINRFGLIENQDYVVYNNFGENPNGGRPTIEYILTIDCAKELSMVEGNEKGKQARQYFIACENKFKDLIQFSIPKSYSEALLLAAKQAEENERLKLENKQMRPKAVFADAVTASNRSCLIGELAKVLNQNGINIGQNRLFKWLRSNGYLCNKNQSYNQPTQKAMNLGLFEIKETTISKPNGNIIVAITPKVTGKGQLYFINKFLSTNNK